ncbi:CmpA/NrtA family ABC transporter substrate-binding protein [Thiomonas intermedia]|uniref:CmpA/NrtA family ABC transporter substrate-binding protein n=1 Tax=Thiomonas intermedia TaxID=926 RepID=UPI0009A5343B|nr:CmpA/NrtA family ABC transporter substrate-binding protein [Thiomonas intermedia]
MRPQDDTTPQSNNPAQPLRRTLIKSGAAAALSGLLPGLQPATRAATLGKPEMEEVKIGFIPLTDCAPVVMASVLGFDKKYGVKIIPSKQASWAAVRDNLLTGGIHMAHALYGLPYGVQLGVGGPKRDMAILMGLNRNGQAISLSDALAKQGVTTGEALAKAVLAKTRTFTFAQTFPTSTHAMWLYYWLATYGINPLKDDKVITVPPPQMVANMRVGSMDGFCVGEPWNAVAIAQKIGFTAATSQDIWPDHPEKALGTTAEFVQKYPNTTKAVMAAVLEACQWIDASLANKTKMANVIAEPGYVNTSVETILPRILGRYTNGLGKSWDDKHPMAFYEDGQVNYPWLSDGMWFLTQFRRWGLIKTDPDYLAVAKAVNRTDLYTEVATALKVPVPKNPMRTSKLIDGVIWDGKDPKTYAHGFKINDMVS